MELINSSRASYFKTQFPINLNSYEIGDFWSYAVKHELLALSHTTT